jgi:hypothetical protein
MKKTLQNGPSQNLTLITNGAAYHVGYTAAMHPKWCMARPARLERATCGFEVDFFLKAIPNHFQTL